MLGRVLNSSTPIISPNIAPLSALMGAFTASNNPDYGRKPDWRICSLEYPATGANDSRNAYANAVDATGISSPSINGLAVRAQTLTTESVGTTPI